MNGTIVCVSAPGRSYGPSISVTITGSSGTSITAVPVPNDILNDTTTRYAKYHDVMVGEYCSPLSLKYGISIDDFITLNPSINENCANMFADGSHLAVQGYIEGCEYVFVYYGITLAGFYNYSPAIGPDCINLWPDDAYCTSTDLNPGESSSSTINTPAPTSAPAPSATPPGQVRSGQAANCNKWVEAQAGDSCWAIADRTGIELEELYEWNDALGQGALSRYATISRTWQRAVERLVFQSLGINSTDQDLDQLVSVVGKRRGVLRRLFYTTTEVAFDTHRIKPRNQQIVCLSNATTRSVQRLFQILADEFDDQRGLSLYLGAIARSEDAKSHENNGQRIGLVVPTVQSVSSLALVIAGNDGRLALNAVADLAGRLPHLKRLILSGLDVGVTQLEGEAAALYLYDRRELAESLGDAHLPTSSSSLSHASLRLGYLSPLSLPTFTYFAFPDCTGLLGYDPLGAAVRNSSYGLEELEVEGVFDSSVFWPSEKEPSSTHSPPSWPRLKQFSARLGLATPSGGWFFDPTPYTYRRDVPCEETLQPLVESWARALESMPVLEQATLAFEVKPELNMVDDFSQTRVEDWSLRYQAPGAKLDPLNRPWGHGLDTGDARFARLFFKNCGNWRPSDATVEKLRKLVESKFGTRLIEYTVDIQYNVERISPG
ncbi:hypothetical protein F5Y14DRAFT_456199 [Nemania sp. NC0429]|nr:hypothetical protein F5Y14DRAFT_456199 [Nemania sp. NC0429]